MNDGDRKHDTLSQLVGTLYVRMDDGDDGDDGDDDKEWSLTENRHDLFSDSSLGQ
jgi:hypothetical protein